jgi:DNA topoisomerase I
MSKTLIIVESPTKAKKIAEYLPAEEYIVVSCRGHITDLGKGSRHGLGVDLKNNFSPKYILLDDQVKTLEMLVENANLCDQILLFTDPDREGEAISWHLKSRLEDLGKPIKRGEFHELTKKALLSAIKNVREINLPLFYAQETRRILDRLVGFMTSPFLTSSFGTSLSAGRVQSVLTKMVVDREREIEQFKPEEFWNIFGSFVNKDNKNFTAKYDKKVLSQTDAEKIKEEISSSNDCFVSEVISADEKKKPNAPLITSKLQQVLSSSFGISAERTMKAAQSLYENGLISYMRTDSTRVSDEALSEARSFLREKGYSVPKSAVKYKNKDAAQDAHECIRPTDPANEPNTLSLFGDEKTVYTVIYQCFLASQMEPAIYKTLKISISSKSYPNHIFKVSGKALKSAGFLAMMGVSADGKEIDLPLLKKGETLSLFGSEPIKLEQKWTQPPSRFSEGNLIKALEKKNIGRPATYAELLSKITVRDYVLKENNIYYPTDLGKKVTDELSKYFSFMDYNYTSQMEIKLDEIADGKNNKLAVLSSFFAPFQKELNKAYKEHGAESCPLCSAPMIMRQGVTKFLGCSLFPSCRFSKSIPQNDTTLQSIGI